MCWYNMRFKSKLEPDYMAMIENFKVQWKTTRELEAKERYDYTCLEKVNITITLVTITSIPLSLLTSSRILRKCMLF